MSTTMKASDRPTALTPRPENIPAALASLPQWIDWRYDLDKDTGEWAKVLYDPRTGRHAKSNNPTTWTTLQAALARFNRGGFAGPGFVFQKGGGFVGIDLDGCRDLLTGELTSWAQEALERLDSYSEVSPSETGVKVFVRGKSPFTTGKQIKLPDAPKVCDKLPQIEVYEFGRYFAVTGHRLGEHTEPQERQAALDWLKEKYAPASTARPRNTLPVSNDRLFERCRKYISEMPRAKSGEGGHNATFAVACTIYKFGLNDTQARTLLTEYNERCEPPWSEHDLEHKLTSARQRVEAEGTFGSKAKGSHERNGHDKGNGAPSSNGHAPRVSPPQSPQASQDAEPSDLPTNSIWPAEGRTEAANAKRLVAAFGNDLHWCDPWEKWLWWDGRRWATDQERCVERFAKKVAADIWQEVIEAIESNKLEERTKAAFIAFAKAASGANGIRNMLALSRSEQGVPVLPASLDTDPWALNVLNGTIDLRTMQLGPHRREDLLTKLCPVAFDIAADCPTWLRFLEDITAANKALSGFLRRAVGYSLTGVVRDHVLLFLYGVGANGKSTFLNTIMAMLGADYALKAPPDLLMVKRGESHPTERADLFGRRFVACIEAEDGRRLAESLVKEMTGGDRIRARRMREDFWEFDASHKIWLAANHRPVIRGTDHGTWRRVKLVPFTVTIPDDRQDKALGEKLLAELPGILNWALTGCQEWQEQGLDEPDEVRQATAGYREEMDVLGTFIADRCIVDGQCWALAGDLYAAYQDWCEKTGEHVATQTRFGTCLAERGFGLGRATAGEHRGRKIRTGIGLRSDEPL